MSRSDHEAGIAAMEAIMVARVAVRRAQDEGRSTLRESLSKAAGDGTADEFLRKVLERAYPKVYRTDPILPLFDSARKIEALSDEQKAALDDLEARYRVEIVAVNDALADAYRSEEPKEPRRRVELLLARQQGAEAVAKARSESEVIVNARKAREELYDRYRKAIMEILNEEQRKAMPIFGKGERVPPDAMEEMRGAKAAPTRLPLVDGRLGQTRNPNDPSQDSRSKHGDSGRPQIDNRRPAADPAPSDRGGGRSAPRRSE